MSKFPVGEELEVLIEASLRKACENIKESYRVDQFELCSHAHTLHEKESSQLKSLVQFLTQNILQVKNNIKANLKSGIRSQFLVEFNKLCCDNVFMGELQELFEPLVSPTTNEVLNVICGVVLFQFSNELLLMVLRKMLGTPVPSEAIVRKKWSSDDIDSIEFKEIIYYIGGAVLHTFHRDLWQHPNCKKLSTFCEVLKDRFQELRDKEESDDFITEEDDTEFELIRDWTEAMNRGGLIFLSKDAHNFFVSIADRVLCCEGSDGSLELEFVFGEVLKDFTVLSYWDTLVGEVLEESVSFDFLQAICDIVVKIARQGILKRRLNELMKSAYISVSLRHRLTR